MRVLFDEASIAERIERLADEIAKDLPEDALIAPILTGAFVFAADLVRALSRHGLNCDVDFLHLSSYGDARVSSGNVMLLKDLQTDVRGRAVLLVDDVLDSGRSIAFAQRLLADRGAGPVKLCVLVDKRAGRAEAVEVDYAGFEADGDAFIIGYGMDDAGRWRGLPHIGVVET
ncbi:MAG: phosphoribosyltransferase family protein [Pseudomonadota bacterium]